MCFNFFLLSDFFLSDIVTGTEGGITFSFRYTTLLLKPNMYMAAIWRQEFVLIFLVSHQIGRGKKIYKVSLVHKLLLRINMHEARGTGMDLQLQILQGGFNVETMESTAYFSMMRVKNLSDEKILGVR